MKTCHSFRRRGFTLLETVIAIGVLAVLLSGFMVVFTPAAEGIRKSINVQQADRLASALQEELVTLHKPDYPTGFNKAYEWIRDSNAANNALLVYQYRGDISSLRSDDKTPTPVANVSGKLPGKDYVVVSMVRRKSDTNLATDLAALEGSVYMVKCTQLIYNGGELKLGTAGSIKDPKGTAASSSADDFPEAVIAFSADFYMMPAKAANYFTGGAFNAKFDTFKNPVFSRNLAVRR
jgi:prepilin-type N-terminal cleavage/methylation domain-containing protein